MCPVGWPLPCARIWQVFVRVAGGCARVPCVSACPVRQRVSRASARVPCVGACPVCQRVSRASARVPCVGACPVRVCVRCPVRVHFPTVVRVHDLIVLLAPPETRRVRYEATGARSLHVASFAGESVNGQ